MKYISTKLAHKLLSNLKMEKNACTADTLRVAEIWKFNVCRKEDCLQV